MSEPTSLKKGCCEVAIREILGPGGSSTPVLIIAGHMDDEAIGTAGMLKYLRNLSVLHITDAAARNMRGARQRLRDP